jgi:phasin family protein
MDQSNITPVAGANGAAMVESSNAATTAFQQLTKAYQELATRNVANLTSAMQSLSSAKSPTEFIAAQQKLIQDGVASAVSDSQTIVQLTAAVFSAAFTPVRQQIESMQKSMPH